MLERPMSAHAECASAAPHLFVEFCICRSGKGFAGTPLELAASINPRLATHMLRAGASLDGKSFWFCASLLTRTMFGEKDGRTEEERLELFEELLSRGVRPLIVKQSGDEGFTEWCPGELLQAFLTNRRYKRFFMKTLEAGVEFDLMMTDPKGRRESIGVIEYARREGSWAADLLEGSRAEARRGGTK